jgi:hypothetical protein
MVDQRGDGAVSSIRVGDIAMARSGDKGADANVGVWARTDEDYETLRAGLTAEAVKAHFAEVCNGEVERYELPKLRALNFILRDALDGGASASLRTDAQGKTYGNGILLLEIAKQ